MVRRGAKRAARSVMQDAIVAWTSINASGKAAQLSEKHEWLLKTATSSRNVDAGCQTVDSLEINHTTAQDHMVITQNLEDDRKHRWIEQNGVTTGERSLDISSVGLGKYLFDWRIWIHANNFKISSTCLVSSSRARSCRRSCRSTSYSPR